MILISRLIALLIVLLGIHGAYRFVQSGVLFSIRPPATDLNELPLELGQWTCITPSERYAEAEDLAGADVSIQRVYRHAAQNVEVTVYAAVWETYQGFFTVPHEPPVCYSVSGHDIVETTDTELELRHGSTVTARIMEAELDDRMTHVLYWYQLDRNMIFNQRQMGSARLGYLGKKPWPPLIKVMLEIRDMDQEYARPHLIDLGERIFEWSLRKL